MRTFWRIGFSLLVIMVVLGTLAVAGILSWIGDHQAVRILVDGQDWSMRMPTGWGFIGLLAAVALSLLLLLTVVPALVLLALVIGLIGTIIGGLFAMAPVLIVAALIWWLVQRPRQAS